MLAFAMAGETKGWMGGGMKFGVGDDAGPAEESAGPLLPLRVLVVADLTPRAPFNAGASPPEQPIRVDSPEFDELFAKLRPRLALEIPSVLEDGRNARVDLSPTSLKSFRPDGLCSEVPLLRSLLDGRLVLERLRDGSVSPEMAQSELERLWKGSRFVREVLGLVPQASRAAPQPAAEPAAAAPSGGIDALLDMVDLAGASYSSPQDARPQQREAPPQVKAETNRFSALISQVAMSGKAGGGATGFRPAEAIARVEKALGAQIGAILQHPEVRRLEEAYRGLRFLTERTQGHAGIRIDVLCARPDEAAEALARAARGASDPPISFAIVDLPIDGSATGFSRLETIANAAEAASLPTIVNGANKLLGVDKLGEVEKLDNKAGVFQAPHQAPWRSAAAKPPARWVTIAMNRVLSRVGYDKNTSRVREAALKELPGDEGAIVWVEPAYVVGALVISSFRDTGWPCRITGVKSGGVVDNLPVREVPASEYEGDEVIAIPTEAFVSTDTQRELSKLGVLVLASAPNSDSIYVLHAPTAYVTPPKKTYDSATTEPELRLERVPLSDQLFVARFVQFLRALCSKMPPNSDPAEVQPIVQAALWELFDGAKPGSLELAVKVAAEAGGAVAQVLVRPGRFLGVGLDELSLEMPLG
jgi:type VI secretion system protein ImpC